MRIAAQRLAAESGAAAVVVELPELPGEVTQEESDDLLRRISGAHAESFPNATSGALAPVVLLDLNGTAILYAELQTGNVTNATILADAYLHDCSCFTFHPILLALILMAWCTMLAVWVSNTWGRNRESATTLHRVIVVVPFLKVCLELITVGLWLSCPWQNSHSPWLFMGWLGVYTWYEASYFGVFILLAKGWCITRPSLQMHDILNAACLLCLLYIVVNTCAGGPDPPPPRRPPTPGPPARPIRGPPRPRPHPPTPIPTPAGTSSSTGRTSGWRSSWCTCCCCGTCCATSATTSRACARR